MYEREIDLMDDSLFESERRAAGRRRRAEEAETENLLRHRKDYSDDEIVGFVVNEMASTLRGGYE
jgi:hypothetical protein